MTEAQHWITKKIEGYMLDGDYCGDAAECKGSYCAGVEVALEALDELMVNGPEGYEP